MTKANHTQINTNTHFCFFVYLLSYQRDTMIRGGFNRFRDELR